MSVRHDRPDDPDRNSRDGDRGTEVVPTILIVDDETYLLDMACRIVRKLGYVAIGAPGAKECLRIYRERAGEISVVLLDVNIVLDPQNWTVFGRSELLNLRPRLALHPLGLEFGRRQIAERGVNPLLHIDIVQEAPDLSIGIAIVPVF